MRQPLMNLRSVVARRFSSLPVGPNEGQGTVPTAVNVKSFAVAQVISFGLGYGLAALILGDQVSKFEKARNQEMKMVFGESVEIPDLKPAGLKESILSLGKCAWSHLRGNA